MKIVKLVALILGLAVVAFLAKTALDGSRAPPQIDAQGQRVGDEHSAPRRQLDNVRSRSHELEDQLRKSAEETEKKADGQ